MKPLKRWMVFASTFLLLAGCEGVGSRLKQMGEAVPILSDALSDDEKAAIDVDRKDTEIAGAAEVTTPPIDEVYEAKRSSRLRPANALSGSAGTLSINFERTELRQALKVLIGDLLGRSFVLPPDLKGEVTLKTARPITREQALSLLESVLKNYGLTSVFKDNLILVTQENSAIGQAVSPNSEAGFGFEVLPLTHVSAGEMAKLLSPMVEAGQGTLLAASSSLLLVNGSHALRRATSDAVLLLDIDRMAGKAVGLIELQNGDAETVLGEVNHLLDNEQDEAASLVRLKVIERLNAILVIAPTRAQVDQARNWIKRLDRGYDADERRLFVYFVRNTNAVDLTKTLSGLYAETQANDVAQEGAAPQPSSRAGAPSFVADKASNAILISATGRQYKSIAELLQKIDIVPLQVLIEGTVMEIRLQDGLRYGLQYFIETGEFSALFTRGDPLTSVNPLAPGFGISIGGPNSSKIVIDALSELTDVSVVSSPQIMVLDGGTARLHVGDQVPIVTRTSSTTSTDDSRIVNEIEYRDTGVTLNVTPTVRGSGLVTLQISQSVSDVVRTDTSDINSPTIQQRQVVSTAAVESGTTVLLAGLIRRSESENESGIPLLHQIPVVGKLFGTTEVAAERTELIVLIRPRVIRNRSQAKEATRDALRRYEGLLESVLSSNKAAPAKASQ